jgi:hypothetical protein
LQVEDSPHRPDHFDHGEPIDLFASLPCARMGKEDGFVRLTASARYYYRVSGPVWRVHMSMPHYESAISCVALPSGRP